MLNGDDRIDPHGHFDPRLLEVLRAIDASGKFGGEFTVRQVADILWAASTPSSFEHLVKERGWAVKTYERWLVHLGHSLLA